MWASPIIKEISLYNRQTTTEKLQPINIQSCKPSSNGYIYNTLPPTPKAQGMLWKREWKDCKSHRIREFAVRLHPLATSEATPIKSYQQDCPNESWTRMTPMSMPSHTGKSPQGLNPMCRTTGHWGKLGAREAILPRREHTNWLSSAKWLALKTYIQVTQHTYKQLNRLHSEIYVYRQIHMCMQSQAMKISHEFEGEQRGHTGGGGWREERGRGKCCH